MADPADPRLPALRASDADRERIADRLRHAAGEGRLTVEELDERLQWAYASRTQEELERLVADVPEVAGEPRARRVPVRPGARGPRWLVAVMSGVDRRGRWRLGPSCTAVNVMGGSELDLNDVELTADEVELQVWSLMGGSEIYVPEGLNVELSEFSVMGGNSVELGPRTPTPGGPVLHLKLISIMGGAEVKRGPKLSRRERKRLKRLGH